MKAVNTMIWFKKKHSKIILLGPPFFKLAQGPGLSQDCSAYDVHWNEEEGGGNNVEWSNVNSNNVDFYIDSNNVDFYIDSNNVEK